MPLDLTDVIKSQRKALRRAKRNFARAEEQEKKYQTKKKRTLIGDICTSGSKGVCPTSFPQTLFLEKPIEEYYDELVSLRIAMGTMQPFETRALTFLTNRLPWPLVKKFFEYMARGDLEFIAPSLKKFIRNDKIKKVLEDTKKYLKTRAAIPAGVYVPPFERESEGVAKSSRCIREYKNAEWVADITGEDVTVVGIVSRLKFGQPVKEGWYHVQSKWYENVCKFGRPFRENYIGYLLEDGRILVENEILYDAASHYFDKGGGGCETTYESAPWMQDELDDIEKLVARRTATTEGWLKRELKNNPGWYALKREWFNNVCQNGRQFISGDIGYRLQSGKIIPETKYMYLKSKSYYERQGEMTRYTGSYSTECVRKVLNPTWVVEDGVSPIGIVAHQIPETKQFIVPTPIEGTDWYYLTRKWYEHICANGREWLPGVFGYRFYDGSIIPETREMYDKYLEMYETNRIPTDTSKPPTDRDIDVAISTLSEVMPEDTSRLLIDYLPKTSLDAFMTEVARIYVFGSRIITIPQVHRKRLANKQYRVSLIPLLTKEMALSEIYEDPSRDPATSGMGVLNWDDFDDRIERRILSMKNRLITGLNDPMNLRRINVRSQPVDRVINVDNIHICSEDPVYYNEDGVMYCFARDEIATLTRNPRTGKRFRKNFVEFVKALNMPVIPVGQRNLGVVDWSRHYIINPPEDPDFDAPGPVIKKRRISPLAPDLLNIARRGYSFGKTCSDCGDATCGGCKRRKGCQGSRHCKGCKDCRRGYSFGSTCKCGEYGCSCPMGESNRCAACDKIIKHPRLKTVYKGEVIGFCNSRCFDDFKFKN